MDTFLRSEAELRVIVPPPGIGALRKQIAHLDENCRAFIAHSPFVLVSTSNAEGRCDVSPKGGPPGFVRVVDDNRLLIPDLPGNRRLDSMRNIVENANAGLLFLIPGLDETLRVNGRAYITSDADAEVMGKARPLGFVVEVEEAFIHCAKAFRRANLWKPDEWPDRTDMPSIACMLRDHVAMPELTEESIAQGLEAGYQKDLY